MRVALISITISALLGTAGAAQSLLVPQIIEKTLNNGIKVLVIERPGSNAVHAHIFIKGGRNNTGNLPPIAADLLARTLFRRALPSELNHIPINTLESGTDFFEKLKLKQLVTSPQPTLKMHPDTSTTALATESAARLTAITNKSEIWDTLDSLGASGRNLVVTADYLSYGIDLPKSAMTTWTNIESNRLQTQPLFRLPMERDRLGLEIASGSYDNHKYLHTLLTTAMPGSSYAATSNISQSHAESVTLDDIKNYAKRIIIPTNIILILIGDISYNSVLPQLEHTFGKILNASNNQVQQTNKLFNKNHSTADIFGPTEGRHLTINTSNYNRVFFSWCVPPINHPDRPILIALTKALSNKCNRYLATSNNPAHKLTVQLGIPGQQDTNLLVIEAIPKDGHSLSELEHIIEHEVMQLRQEPLSNQKLHQLQTNIQLDEIIIQEDAHSLAENLGKCLSQGDSWHPAFSALEASKNITATELQLAAQTYLAPHKMTIVSLTPNLTFLPINWAERQIIQIVRQLLERKSVNATKVQKILGETLRQLRMLSAKEQLQLFKLLECQGNQ